MWTILRLCIHICLFHFIHQCLMLVFCFFFVSLFCCFCLNVLLCYMELVKEPLLYFMFVSTFYFACLTWLCLDILFGKFRL